eukprot:5158992-Amphidinium_carterae.2
MQFMVTHECALSGEATEVRKDMLCNKRTGEPCRACQPPSAVNTDAGPAIPDDLLLLIEA